MKTYLLALVCVFLSSVASAQAHQNHPNHSTSPTSTAKFAQLFKQASQNQPPIGGPFTLTDINQNPVTEKSLLGKYHLLFFGFTTCPDVCPAAMQQMASIYQQLTPKQQKQTQVVLISIDPKTDTIAKLKSFVTSFNPSFTAWRGTKEQIDEMTRNYLAYYAIKAEGPDQYQINHSSYIYLMGPNGKYLTHFRSSDSEETILNGLKNTLKPIK